MVIEQTVDIPADHRLVLDVPLPLSLPQGKVRIALTVTPETPPHGAAMMPLLAMCGIDRGKDTLDAYFERKRSDKAREDGQIERQLRSSGQSRREDS
ncbi:MAG: hypothetical protein LBC88_02825 [Spirochaetaceae bacterium]|jgi:hypothetical protein|nr:hypothetical protein [Spirochaetaceae bacterium]